jgi:uncharacterized glyoxalase superfamily protein PhnB
MPVHEMFPYLCVPDGNAAIEFYTNVFGAREKFRLTEPGGRIGHAELDFDGSILMLAEEFPEIGLRAPDPKAPASASIHLHVDDADAVVRLAAENGATIEMEPADQFYGERSGSFRDPFGHRWLIGHSIENVTPAEMQRRYEDTAQGC